MDWTAAALLAPPLLFLLFAFAAPIAAFLERSVANTEAPGTLPRTMAVLGRWTGDGMPPDAAYDALLDDLHAASPQAVATLARRLNEELPGARSLVIGAARLTTGPGPASGSRAEFWGQDPRWADPAIWAALRRDRFPLTPFFLLAAVDMRQDDAGGIVGVDPDRAIYLQTFARTVWISLLVTLASLAIAYPVAYALAHAPRRLRAVLLACVLLPFWTSLLVRTLAWVVLLQRDGLLNQALLTLHLSSQPLTLLFTRGAVIVAMVHILVPVMVLPIWSAMRRVPPSHRRAAVSLGATPARAFWTVYVPATLPGVSAGVVLALVLGLGFFITPELLGGPADQMVSHFVAFFTNQSVNWGLSAALGTWLLVLSLALFFGAGRLFRVPHSGIP